MEQKYVNHTLKNTDGKFIYGKRETEAILRMIYAGENFTNFDGKMIKVFSDEIVTEGKDVKRVTILEITG